MRATDCLTLSTYLFYVIAAVTKIIAYLVTKAVWRKPRATVISTAVTEPGSNTGSYKKRQHYAEPGQCQSECRIHVNPVSYIHYSF